VFANGKSEGPKRTIRPSIAIPAPPNVGAIGSMIFTPHLWQRLFVIGTIIFVGAACAIASERWETLEAIHWVENPRDSPKPGPMGELGAYQFRQSTWRSYTKRPFVLALERRFSDDVAVQHYEWIKRSLQGAGIEPVPYNIALAWNAGLGPVVKGRAPAAAYDYASRVNGLVEMLKARRAPSGPPAVVPQPKADAPLAVPTDRPPSSANVTVALGSSGRNAGP